MNLSDKCVVVGSGLWDVFYYNEVSESEEETGTQRTARHRWHLQQTSLELTLPWTFQSGEPVNSLKLK